MIFWCDTVNCTDALSLAKRNIPPAQTGFCEMSQWSRNGCNGISSSWARVRFNIRHRMVVRSRKIWKTQDRVSNAPIALKFGMRPDSLPNWILLNTDLASSRLYKMLWCSHFSMSWVQVYSSYSTFVKCAPWRHHDTNTVSQTVEWTHTSN